MHRWNRQITNWRWDGLFSYDLSHFCLVLRLQLFNTNITMMHNSYMILKMMFWISFCSDFFVTNFTMMINDFLSLVTMVLIFNSLDSQFWRWISRMGLLICNYFGISVTKFAIIMQNDLETDFLSLETMVWIYISWRWFLWSRNWYFWSLFVWFFSHKVRNYNEGFENDYLDQYLFCHKVRNDVEKCNFLHDGNIDGFSYASHDLWMKSDTFIFLKHIIETWTLSETYLQLLMRAFNQGKYFL